MFWQFPDHQSRCRFVSGGEAEDVEVRLGLEGLLLGWPEATDRKSKSTRRRAQVVEPGPTLRTIRSFPHWQKQGLW